MKIRKMLGMFCAVCMLLSVMVTPGSAVEISNTNEFVNELESFLAETVYAVDDMYNLPNFDNISLGKEIPGYISTGENEYTESPSRFYPVISAGTVVGLVESREYTEGSVALTYSEGYADEINEVSEQNIAIICDGKNLEIVCESDILQLNYSSVNLSYANPHTEEIPLYINSTRSIPDGHTITIPVKYQTKTWDCWAACVASVGQYYTQKDYTSLQVAKEYGKEDVGTIDDTKDALSKIYSVSTSGTKYSLSTTNLMNYIYRDERPIIAGYMYGANIGHMFVIHGYGSGSSYLNLYLLEPQVGFISARVIRTSDMSFNYLGYTFTLNEYIF